MAGHQVSLCSQRQYDVRLVRLMVMTLLNLEHLQEILCRGVNYLQWNKECFSIERKKDAWLTSNKVNYRHKVGLLLLTVIIHPSFTHQYRDHNLV